MEFASPRWAAYDDTSPLRESTTPDATYAVSAQYAAYANYRGVFARKLTTNEHYKRLFRYDDDRPWFQPVLAFSTIRGQLLAIATGVQILVFDLENKKVKHVLKGNGRIVTTLAWAESKPGIIATGAVDGSICVWSLKHSARPLHHVRTFHSACTHVAFHPQDHELLAGCHKSCVSVWALPSTRPILVSAPRDFGIRALRWFATEPFRVLAISAAGTVSIYDIQHALAEFKSNVINIAGNAEEGVAMSGKLENAGYVPAYNFELGLRISQASLIGRNGLIVLPRYGHILYFITFFADKDEATELWRLRLDDLIDCFSLRVRDGTVQVVACIGADTQTYEVPAAVLHGMGWDAATLAHHYGLRKSGYDRDVLSHRTMRPELAIFDRRSHSPPSRKPSLHESAQRPHFRTTTYNGSTRPQRSRADLDSTALPSITSSLELPKPKNDADDQQSPMPFLSPSVPARRISFGHAMAPVVESIRLPPRASFDSITSTAGHDSDSDDETFAERLQGSGTLLPGGVNVPLPRTCGAAFGRNGQLIIFFPSRATPLLHDEEDSGEVHTRHERRDSEVSRLFPTFGNLTVTSPLNAVVSESESGSPPDQHMRSAQRYSIPTSSFGDTRWALKVSPVKSTTPNLGSQKVKVLVYDTKNLRPSRRLAYDYSIIPQDDASATSLCRHNAELAAAAKLDEASKIWHLLAIIVEQRSCEMHETALQLEGNPHGQSSQRPSISRNLSMASSYAGHTDEPNVIKLRWALHPLGKRWAIERILRWAEKQADVQLLACVSSLVTHVSERIRNDCIRPLNPSLPHDPSVASASRFAASKSTPNILLLRTGTDIIDASLLEESPVKPHSSRASSRDPSLPPTPLDSSASTPPLPWPTSGRHGARLSASGSASPETNRGSFSAAAKYYAQTISDKLTGYSTSPPMRKLGNSPGNELSTSLPTATGSWSKSVSFAAASDAAQESRRSLSLAREDEDYDSDRTIDDLSLPRTPNPGAGVVVRGLSGQSFWNETYASISTSSLMPDHLVTHSSIWRTAYAEQLRSWDLLIEATEMENTSDLADTKSTASVAQTGEQMELQMSPQCRGTTCCICFCAIKAAKQLCPACLHTTHPGCLEECVADLEGDKDEFTCPTGCGCNCIKNEDTQYGFEGGAVIEETAGEELQSELSPRSHFAKRRSLTDPKLLRERLEGGSW